VAADLAVRPAQPTDRDAVTDLLRLTLQAGDDPRYERFLAWKHRENPFGESLEWVATLDGAIVGYRTFLRWRFRDRSRTYDAVRAVDTATHPAHQGKGIFRTLTLAAVDDMTAAGIDFVFNTPNDQSRPGYLKMGWRQLGRVPVRVRPTLPPRLGRLRSARAPAERFGEPVTGFPTIGEAALPAPPAGDHLRTDAGPDFLRWRYGLEDLGYRVARGDNESAAVFRVRRRGRAREATFSELAGSRRAWPALVRSVLRATGADLATLPDDAPLRAALRVTRIGPTLCVRDLAGAAPEHLEAFRLSLGDLELF
jgi:GNAT superfamily N-acetyltransferase